MTASVVDRREIPRYMPQLDGLRAIAVGAVMLHHFLPLARFVPYDFITLGDLGVRLFFVLSGFLITGILLRCKSDVANLGAHSRHPLRMFYVRRFLRIFPVYYLALGFAALLNLPTVRDSLPWHAAYLSNVFFARSGQFNGPLSHFWSLAVEEQFYFIWPWLIVFAPSRHVPRIIAASIVGAIAFRLYVVLSGGSDLAAFILLPGCMDSLGIGDYSRTTRQSPGTRLAPTGFCDPALHRAWVCSPS